MLRFSIQGRLSNIYYKCWGFGVNGIHSKSCWLPHVQGLCRRRGLGKVVLLSQGESDISMGLQFLNSFVAWFLGLMFLFHLLVNCLRVVWIDCLYVCRVCFDCVSHQWGMVAIYCDSATSGWSCFQRIFFFNFPPPKNGLPPKKIKKQFSQDPPHLTTDVSPRQLRIWY